LRLLVARRRELVVDHAQRQHVIVPGETVAADLIGDVAAEALICRGKLAMATDASPRSSATTLTRPSSSPCPGCGPRGPPSSSRADGGATTLYTTGEE